MSQPYAKFMLTFRVIVHWWAYLLYHSPKDKVVQTRSEIFVEIVFTLAEFRLWNLLSNDNGRTPFILHWTHKLSDTWDGLWVHMNCFLPGVMNYFAIVHLCCKDAWQEVNSCGLRVMRGPECEASFICLLGHVCWAGVFYLNNSTPMYRGPDLSDTDQLLPLHREPG